MTSMKHTSASFRTGLRQEPATQRRSSMLLPGGERLAFHLHASHYRAAQGRASGAAKIGAWGPLQGTQQHLCKL